MICTSTKEKTMVESIGMTEKLMNDSEQLNHSNPIFTNPSQLFNGIDNMLFSKLQDESFNSLEARREKLRFRYDAG